MPGCALGTRNALGLLVLLVNKTRFLIFKYLKLEIAGGLVDDSFGGLNSNVSLIILWHLNAWSQVSGPDWEAWEMWFLVEEVSRWGPALRCLETWHYSELSFSAFCLRVTT